MTHEQPRHNRGIVELLGGVGLFIGGAALEKYAGVDNATLGGFIVGTVVALDGLRVEGQAFRQK